MKLSSRLEQAADAVGKANSSSDLSTTASAWAVALGTRLSLFATSMMIGTGGSNLFNFSRNQGGFRTIRVPVKHNQVGAALSKAEDTFMAVTCAGGFPSVILEQGTPKIQIDEVATNAQHALGNTLSHCLFPVARDSTRRQLAD